MEKQSSKYFLFGIDKMNPHILDHFSNEEISLREKLNRRNKKVSFDDVSYRILNHWETNGLLEADRGEDGTGWRKYSVMDLVWVKLISELRNFGVSIENIQYVKKQMVNSNDEEIKPSIYPLLEFYTAFFLSSRQAISIMVFDDFQVLVGTQTQIEVSTKFNSIGNHIRIGLPGILQQIFKDKILVPRDDPKFRLTEKELELIIEIRTGAYESISVKMKNGDLVTMEKEKIVPASKTIHDLLKGNDYDEIILKRENGTVRNITQILKKKF